jgi:hypothetical protein
VDVTSTDHGGRTLRRVPKQNLENNPITVSAKSFPDGSLHRSDPEKKLKVGKETEKGWRQEKGKMLMSKQTAF